VEVGELVEALFQEGLSTRRINRILEVLYHIKLSPQTTSRLARAKDAKAETFLILPVVFPDVTFLSFRGGNVEK